MAQQIVLDALYPEMEEATVGQWLVAEGQEILPGQPIAELITDKVAYEYESPGAGIMLAILVAEKSVVPVGTVLGVIGEAGERLEGLDSLRQENLRLAAEREAVLMTLQEITARQVGPATPGAPGGVRATPAARRMAREHGIDLSNMSGSGPNGMITVDDIARLIR